MKRKLHKILAAMLVLITIVIILNLRVNTRQGINYKVYSIKIPLYLKALDFFDRYYNYRRLVDEIIKGVGSDEEKMMKIFEWTHNNIRKAPKELPLVDDHIWYTIVRGYGAEDQFQDVFTTLCNFAGIDAFFGAVYTKDKSSKIIFSFVRIKKKWHVLDAYRGVYFKDNQGSLANIEDKNRCSVISLADKPDIDYTLYLENLPAIGEIGLNRANIQSPVKRLLYEIKKRMR